MADDYIPPLPQHPKPKSKGKKFAPPKLETGPDVEALDVFETAMNADAGADSSGDSSHMLDLLIRHLSGSELKQLDRLVQKVQGRVLHPQRQQQIKQAYERMAQGLSDRRQKSVTIEAQLARNIEKTLETLVITDIHLSNKGKLQSIHIDGKKMSARRFIERYFEKEIGQVKTLLDDGALVLDRPQATPRSFLEGVLGALLGRK